MAFFLLALLAVRLVVNRPWPRLAAYAVCSAVVLFWWLSISATNNPAWDTDVSEMAWAEIHGDQVVVHNVRNCRYRRETEYSDCWSDRTYNLSQLRGVDFFLDNWGIKFASHPIISFDFGDQQGRSIQPVLNETMDDLMYNRGRLVSDGLSFPELKERQHINAAAHAAGESTDFCKLIRVGRIGY